MNTWKSPNRPCMCHWLFLNKTTQTPTNLWKNNLISNKKKKNAKGSVRIQLGKQKPLLAFPVGRDLEQEVRCWRNIWKSLEAGNWRRASASSLVFHQGIWKLLLPPGLDQQGSTEGSELPAAKRPPPSYSPLPQRPLQSSGSAKATPLPPTSGRRIMASALGHLPALACGPHHDRG